MNKNAKKKKKRQAELVFAKFKFGQRLWTHAVSLYTNKTELNRGEGNKCVVWQREGKTRGRNGVRVRGGKKVVDTVVSQTLLLYSFSRKRAEGGKEGTEDNGHSCSTSRRKKEKK